MNRWIVAVAAIVTTVAVADNIITPTPTPSAIHLDGVKFSPPISNNATYDARTFFLLNQLAERATASPKVFNVKASPYFAKGDGRTNDTAAIRAAFTAASAEGGTVYFPSGTYCVYTNPRITGSNVRVTGASDGSSLLKACFGAWDNPNPDVAALISVLNLDGGRLSDITVDNIGFYGSGVIDAGHVSGPKAFTATKTDRVTISNIRAENFGNEVIWPGGGPNNHWEVSDSNIKCTQDAGQIMWPGAAIQGNFEHGRIVGNNVENCYTAIGASGNYIAVTGNAVVNPLMEGIGIGDQDGSGLYCSVSGNTISITSPPANTLGSPIRGIGINGAARSSSVTGNTITALQTTGGSANIRGIYGSATDGVHNISSNNFYMDQASKSLALLGFNAEAASTSSPVYILTGNGFHLTNESTAGSYAYSAASTGGTPSITLMLNGNYAEGVTRAKNGYCIYASQANGGTVRVHGLGNVCNEGRQAYISKDLNSSYHDNAPIYFTNTSSGDAGIQLNP